MVALVHCCLTYKESCLAVVPGALLGLVPNLQGKLLGCGALSIAYLFFLVANPELVLVLKSVDYNIEPGLGLVHMHANNTFKI